MKKSTTKPAKPTLCPACNETPLRQGIDPMTNLLIVWCPSPSCIDAMNRGAQARTFEDAFKELVSRAKQNKT